MSRSPFSTPPWIALSRPSLRVYSHANICSAPLSTPNPESIAPVRAIPIATAKVPRKRQKRAPGAAGPANPLGFGPQHASPAYSPANVTNDSMQNSQNTRNERNPKPLPAHGSFQAMNMPSGGNQSMGKRAAPTNPRAQNSPALNANSPDFYPQFQTNMSESNPSMGGNVPSRQMPTPQSQSLPSGPPSNTFGAFNASAWNQMNINNIPPAAPPPIPFISPNFFDPAFLNNMPPGFPMLPFNPMLPFQDRQPMSTFAGPRGAYQSPSQWRRSPTPPVEEPSPTEKYMQQASQEPQMCSQPRPLLVILDLNGTLIRRKHKRLPPSFAKRYGLSQFLDKLTKKYAVMIWSSSRPDTVDAICNLIFTPEERRRLVVLWGRDKFGLTKRQYNAKLQVYKELQKVWADPEVQASYPSNNQVSPTNTNTKAQVENPTSHFSSVKGDNQPSNLPEGQRWDQSNTILIDDSKLKALSEPYNILEIPEFTNDPQVDESKLFSKVLAKLDMISRHDDASKTMRVWNERVASGEGNILDLALGNEEEDLDDDEDGGISLIPPTNDPEIRSAASSPTTSARVKLPPLPPKSDDPKAAQLRKDAKKERKKAKKAAKKAAEQAKKDAQPAPANPTEPAASIPGPASGPVKVGRRLRKAKHGSTSEDPLETNSRVIDVPHGQRYAFRQPRSFTQRTEAGQGVEMAEVHDSNQATGLAPNLPGDEQAATIPYQQHPFQADVPRRSPSPATSSGSTNSLLDRLEDGLGFPRSK